MYDKRLDKRQVLSSVSTSFLVLVVTQERSAITKESNSNNNFKDNSISTTSLTNQKSTRTTLAREVVVSNLTFLVVTL